MLSSPSIPSLRLLSMNVGVLIGRAKAIVGQEHIACTAHDERRHFNRRQSLGSECCCVAWSHRNDGIYTRIANRRPESFEHCIAAQQFYKRLFLSQKIPADPQVIWVLGTRCLWCAIVASCARCQKCRPSTRRMAHNCGMVYVDHAFHHSVCDMRGLGKIQHTQYQPDVSSDCVQRHLRLLN